MNLNSRTSLISRLRRSNVARQQFVESTLTKALAHQIRATRDRLGWSQERLAEEVKMNQNAISRLESSEYGKPTITTLKRLAAALDVGLVVRFVPFSEMVDWVSGTPRTIDGLNTSALAVANFDTEESEGRLENEAAITELPVSSGAADSARTGVGLVKTEPPIAVGHYSLSAALNAATPMPWIRQDAIPTGAMHAAEIR
jgi:transcriptional regulator with XRE-family HTH domain